MSDFDDEPTEGLEATEPEAGTATKAPRSKPVPDDDWDDDDWDDDDTGRGGKRDLTLVYAIVAAAIVIVLAVVLTRPKDDNSSSDGGNDAAATTAPAEIVKNWQGGVGDAVGKDGADAQKRAEKGEGVYVWTDFGGWHLRSNNTQDVSVTVAADQVRVKKTDDGDDGDESGDAPFSTETTVTLPAGDGKDGIGLDLGNSESVTFTFTIDGKNVAADQIFLGGGDAVAEANPVTLTKS
ncbi:MAG: hypothetical protein ACTHN0_02190 [Aquihabitans sp.]